MAEDEQMTRQQYRQRHGQTVPADDGDDQASEPTPSRQAYAAQTNQELEEAKTKRLARKLNWVIFGLVLAIIIVFLILFFT